MLSFLDGYKTNIVCIVAIISLIVMAWNNQITWVDSYNGILRALTIMGIRSGMKQIGIGVNLGEKTTTEETTNKTEIPKV
jgi:hypothetical protein